MHFGEFFLDIKVGHGARTNRLDFGDDPDQDLHPGFLEDLNPEIFYCPAWMTNLSHEDISSYF